MLTQIVLLQTSLVIGAGQSGGDSMVVEHDHRSGAQPAAYTPQRMIDLGAIREGQEASATFEIENRGDRDLHITGVRSSCGCTTVKLTEEEMSIRPGETRNIVARFDSTGRLGRQRKYVTVKLDDTHTPMIRFTFQAKVETLFRVIPRSTVHMRTVQRGSQLDPLHLAPTDASKRLEIVKIDAPTNVIAYELTEATIDEGTPGYRLDLRVPDDAELGAVRAEMPIVGKVGGETAKVTVRIAGQIVGEIVTRPTVLQSLPPTPRGRRFQTIHVVATNDKPFKLLEADAGPYLELTVDEKKAGSEYQIRAVLAETAPDGPLASTLRIRTDNQAVPVLEVPVFINVRHRAQVEPAIVLFDRNSPAIRRVLIRSPSDMTFKVKGLNTSGPIVKARMDESEQPNRAASVHYLWIELADDAGKADPLDAHVTVYTDIEGAEPIDIPVRYRSSS